MTMNNYSLTSIILGIMLFIGGLIPSEIYEVFGLSNLSLVAIAGLVYLAFIITNVVTFCNISNNVSKDDNFTLIVDMILCSIVPIATILIYAIVSFFVGEISIVGFIVFALIVTLIIDALATICTDEKDIPTTIYYSLSGLLHGTVIAILFGQFILVALIGIMVLGAILGSLGITAPEPPTRKPKGSWYYQEEDEWYKKGHTCVGNRYKNYNGNVAYRDNDGYFHMDDGSIISEDNFDIRDSFGDKIYHHGYYGDFYKSND